MLKQRHITQFFQKDHTESEINEELKLKVIGAIIL